MNEDLKIKIEKDDGINCIMSINYFSSERSIFTGTADVIHKVLNEYKIDHQNVNSIKIIKKERQINIKLKYSKVNLSNLTSKNSQQDQIIKLIKSIGYSQEDIIDISLNIKNGKNFWKVMLNSKEEYNDKYSKSLVQLKISKQISKELNLNVSILIN